MLGELRKRGAEIEVQLDPGQVVRSVAVLTDGAATAACELAGGGPEDPFADACAIALDVALTAACEEAIKHGEKSGLHEFLTLCLHANLMVELKRFSEAEWLMKKFAKGAGKVASARGSDKALSVLALLNLAAILELTHKPTQSEPNIKSNRSAGRETQLLQNPRIGC